MAAGAPGPQRDNQHRIDQLERELRHARRQIDRLLELRAAQATTPQQVRLVKTWDPAEDEESADEYPTYPANIFPIKFLDGSCSQWTPGDHAPSYAARTQFGPSVACTFDRRYLLPGKICQAVLLNGHYWITAGPGLTYFALTKTALSAGGSVDVWLYDGVAAPFALTAFEMTVHDFYLTGSRTIAQYTKVEIEMKAPGVYFVVGAACEASPEEAPE